MTYNKYNPKHNKKPWLGDSKPGPFKGIPSLRIA